MLHAAQAAQRAQYNPFELEPKYYRVPKFWWETSQPRVSMSEENVRIGRPSLPLEYLDDAYDKKELLDYIQSQLKQGIKVPWKYREYGARVVEKMFNAGIKIGRSHAKGGKDMLAPTNSILDKYNSIVLSMYIAHGNSVLTISDSI